MSEIEQTPSGPPKLTWLKQIVRYVVHLIILYDVFGFSITLLPILVYMAVYGLTRGINPTPRQEMQFIISHLISFSVIPAFVVGLLINAKFRHKAAEYIWIIPVVLLAYEFFFHGPGIYPTMLGDSDFPRALHYFFGGGLPTDLTSVDADLSRVFIQIWFTMPVYGAIAYSVGAFLGMNPRNRALQKFMEKF